MYRTRNLPNPQELLLRKVTRARVFERPSHAMGKQIEAIQRVKMAFDDGDVRLEARGFGRERQGRIP
jgi:hypothetical protein